MKNTMKALNEQHWAQAHIVQEFPVSRSSPARLFDAVAMKLLSLKPRYQAASDKTGVPWFVIAVIHHRESGGRFDCNLANGQPLNMVTTLVPKGRGPYKSWEDSAVDALVNCHPHAASNKDWGIGGTLTLLEQYNGLGYFKRGLPSPYIWAGTSEYQKGKYVRDGVFDPNAVDQQLGCAGIIMALMKLDTSVGFKDEPCLCAPKPERTLWQKFWNFLNTGEWK